ncbi:MAG: hypothetical protein PUP90_13840 [Nostoc sp. S4]|nr:hypothetical protein [Nostoc sp. S4]
MKIRLLHLFIVLGFEDFMRLSAIAPSIKVTRAAERIANDRRRSGLVGAIAFAFELSDRT